MPLRGDEQGVKARNDGEDGRKRNNGRVSFDIFDFMIGDPDQVARKKYYFQSRIVRTDRDKFTNQNGRNREIFDFFLLPRVYKQYSCPNNCFFTTALFVLQRVRPKNLEFSPIFFSRENGVIKY
jgi:hypothetical protein